MKFNYILFAFVAMLAAMSCEKKYPQPEMPDISGLSSDFTPFTLSAPASGATVEVDAANTTDKITISWNRTTALDKSAVTYKWLAVAGATPTFATPLLNVNSDSTGKAPMLTFTHAQLVTVLQAQGVAEGQSLNLKWTVRATSASGKTGMATSAYSVTLYRKPQTLPVTFELANFPKSTPANGKVFLAGQFGFLGFTPSGDWQQPGTVSQLEAVKDMASGTYKVTLQLAPNKTIGEFKWFFVPNGTPSSWSNGEQRFKYSDGSAEGMPNRSWTFTGTNTNPKFSVAKWEGLGTAPTSLNRFTVKADPSVVIPANQYVYVAGEISGTATYGAYFEKSGNWAQPGTNPANELMFDSGSGNWFVWLPVGTATNLQYKPFVAAGDSPSWDRGLADASCAGQGNQVFTFTASNGPTFTNVKFQQVTPCP